MGFYANQSTSSNGFYGRSRSSNGFYGKKKSSGGELDVESLAQENGIKFPDPKPLFSKLVDVLNKPSEITEKVITGGKGYESVLSGMGIQNTKGKLDANDVISLAGQMVLDPLNLVAPLGLGTKALKGAGAGVKVASKVKPIGTGVKLLEDLLVPGAKAGRVSKAYVEARRGYEVGTAAKQSQAVRKVADLYKEFGPEVSGNLRKLFETGAPLEGKEAEAVAKVQKMLGEMTEAERKAGVLPKQLVENYFPNLTEREAMKAAMGGAMSKSSGFYTKGRKFATSAEGEAEGVVYKNPLQALALRMSKSETARANAGFLEKMVGGEIKDNMGESVVKEMKDADQLLPGHVAVRIDKQGVRVGDKFLGYFPTTSETGSKMIGVKSLGANFQMPAEIADDFSKFYKTMVSDDGTKQLLKYYDKALGIWKASVTSLFPAFHIRNAVGNLSNMWLGGFMPTDVGRLADAAIIQKGGKVKIKGVEWTADKLEQLGVMGRGEFGFDINSQLQAAGAIGGKTTAQKLNPMRVLEGGRRVGTTIEDNSRVAFFLSRVAKGDDVGQALTRTHKYLFDYSNLTDFERGVMKRVVPFYTWMRNNIPLQIESLITQPGKQAVYAKAFKNLSQMTEEERKNLPTYLQEGLTASYGRTPEGNMKLLSSTGLPIEDLGRLWRGSPQRTIQREVLGSSGPLGTLLGMATNTDLYRGKNISESGYTYGWTAKDYPEPIKKLLEFREETSSAGNKSYYVNPEKYQLLNLIAGRIMKTTSGQLSGEPLSGINFFKTSEQNPEENKTITEKARRDALIKLLEKAGKLKEFRSTYIPKQ